MNFKKWVCCLFLIIAFLAPVFALDIPASPANYVNDYAGALTAGQQAVLNSDLKNFEDKTSNQIFIAVFGSLEAESLEDFSIRLADKWKPGVEGKDNGVLITVFMREQRVRIEVGYGLEGALTDALSDAIIRKELAPHFREGDYYTGIKNTVQKIMAVTQGEFTADELREYSQESVFGGIISLIFHLVIAAVIIAFIIKHPFLAFIILRGVVLGGRGGGRGGGFGGGRGGGFGGGGASGGW